MHRDPAPDGYRSVRVSSPQEAVIPTFAPPVFAITTAELDLSGWTEGDDAAAAEA
ncbi:hypothetical protein [Chthonobacter rhizosphaerae]|uniref:hypothetical protein n=1 Tax=Chthonobacter rhizosphaerae TaxID=2735553 RepID=UPI0015EF2B4F|nr:hypothetical protein [Chthonobacter rhizosphaerae]